jgi:hypothetical protein
MASRLRKVTVKLAAEAIQTATRITGKGITPTIIEGPQELEHPARRSALRPSRPESGGGGPSRRLRGAMPCERVKSVPGSHRLV